MIPKRKREVRFELPPGTIKRQANCRGCNAPVFWIDTNRDKKMPLDIRSAQRELDGRVTYLSHFATCPHADTFRRER